MRIGRVFSFLHEIIDGGPGGVEPVPDPSDGALISAYFGLDGGIGMIGWDGIPLVFETELDARSIDAGDFEVTTASGEVGHVLLATPFPAIDEGERRSVVLVGDLGSAEDQPVTVEVVGDVYSADGTVNYRGAVIEVTPLEAGPSLVYAEIAPEDAFGTAEVGTIPEDGGTVIRTTWNGGVTKPDGEELDASSLEAFTVSVLLETGETVEVHPVAMSDLDDHDNNQLLYLPVEGTPLTVSFEAGQAADPSGDVNETTAVEITPLADTGPYDTIIYFGDSFTDSGEFFNLSSEVLIRPLPSPAFGYDGQVSNGPVYADIAPELLGIDADNVLNYAVGGAQAVGEQDMGALLAGSPLAKPDPNPDFVSYDINLGAQVDRFLEDAAGMGDLSGSAASITIGLNDLRQLPGLIDPENPDPVAVRNAVAALLAEVLAATMQAATELAEAGVGTIIINTLPVVTRENPSPEQQFLSNVISQYNDALLASTAELEALGVEVVTVDFEAMFRELTANGSNYGFLETEDARQDGPLLVDPDGDGPLPAAPGYEVNPEVAALDPDQHVFWDTIHPTTAAHGVLGAFQAATLQGDRIEFLGDGRDIEHGTAGADLIFAQGGNDEIRSGKDADVVFGGAGRDRLHGEAGSDILAGGDGNDRVDGGQGADVVVGNAGDDRLFGGQGDDAIVDGLGSDHADGGHGNDVFFYAEAGLIGGTNGTDEDLFIGGAGEDTLYLVVTDASRASVEAQLAAHSGGDIRFSKLGLTISGIETVVLLDDRAAFDDVVVSEDLQPTLDEAEAWNLV